LLHSCFRIQTPGPSTGGFKERFEKVGSEVWKEWDNYLGDTWNGNKQWLIKICTDRILDGSGNKSFSEEPENGLLSKSTDASVPWDLQTDSDGWPILPLELGLPLPQLKEILRSFLTLTYRELIQI
jgi:hypothetical protein